MAGAYALCAPTDAVSLRLDEAASVLCDLGFEYCELRTVDGVSVADLPLSRWHALARLLQQKALRVALVDSNVGDADIGADFRLQLDRLARALKAAQAVGAGAVRVYSFRVSQDTAEAARGEVIGRFQDMVRLAAESETVLLVENLPGSYCQSGQRLGDLVEGVSSPFLAAVFNPAHFVALKEHPFLVAFMPGPAKIYVRCLRVRDAVYEDGRAVLPDQGNGDLRELVSALACRNYDGFFSLDSGLPASPEGFRAAYAAFCGIVNALL
jgi:sugar phosphate isomerase/epimerase